ncbi:uncharacterized protein LOC114755906 [Neltuma alba]|uniref:uncharacterized protein LOC114755906 n=1 Tax=Neltuma alba TaxID=207710 RepID=UPI0010A536B0|nr:uncharacterized protein LOC114755906 [Prosopis alba]
MADSVVSDSTTASPSIDQTSPYYIHPNENPALILVAPPLDGSNYHTWARSMRMALLSKKFVDGSLPPPSAFDPMFPYWECCNNLVQGWLTKLLSPTIAKSILWFDRASDIWTDLCSRYSQSDIFRIADLQEEIHSLKQGNLNVTEYYTRLKILWDELSSIRPIKPCACSSHGSAAKHREEDYVIRFLKGLNEQYASVKSQIMMLDPLPSITRTFSLVLQQEREFHIAPEPKIMLTKGSRPSPAGSFIGSNQSTIKQCTYCGKPRHTEETCYRKHGFPLGFRFRNGSSASVNNFLTQDFASVQEIHPSKPLPPHHSTQTMTILPQLSVEQYQHLLTLLSPSPPSASTSVNHVSTSVSSVFLLHLPVLG